MEEIPKKEEEEENQKCNQTNRESYMLKRGKWRSQTGPK